MNVPGPLSAVAVCVRDGRMPNIRRSRLLIDTWDCPSEQWQTFINVIFNSIVDHYSWIPTFVGMTDHNTGSIRVMRDIR